MIITGKASYLAGTGSAVVVVSSAFFSSSLLALLAFLACFLFLCSDLFSWRFSFLSWCFLTGFSDATFSGIATVLVKGSEGVAVAAKLVTEKIPSIASVNNIFFITGPFLNVLNAVFGSNDYPRQGGGRS
jgi:hypothetical protein